jgi:hypothetical protein
MKCSNRVFEHDFVDLPGIAEKALSELCLTIRKTKNSILVAIIRKLVALKRTALIRH